MGVTGLLTLRFHCRWSQSEFVISGGDVNLTVAASSALFGNNGTLTVALPAASNVVRLNAWLSHRGTLNLQKGGLVMLGGSDTWGPIAITEQASINFAAASHNINIGTTVVSSGTMYYTGGAINYQYDPPRPACSVGFTDPLYDNCRRRGSLFWDLSVQIVAAE
jgi:hypothetical protein